MEYLSTRVRQYNVANFIFNSINV